MASPSFRAPWPRRGRARRRRERRRHRPRARGVWVGLLAGSACCSSGWRLPGRPRPARGPSRSRWTGPSSDLRQRGVERHRRAARRPAPGLRDARKRSAETPASVPEDRGQAQAPARASDPGRRPRQQRPRGQRSKRPPTPQPPPPHGGRPAVRPSPTVRRTRFRPRPIPRTFACRARSRRARCPSTVQGRGGHRRRRSAGAEFAGRADAVHPPRRRGPRAAPAAEAMPTSRPPRSRPRPSAMPWCGGETEGPAAPADGAPRAPPGHPRAGGGCGPRLRRRPRRPWRWTPGGRQSPSEATPAEGSRPGTRGHGDDLAARGRSWERPADEPALTGADLPEPEPVDPST